MQKLYSVTILVVLKQYNNSSVGAVALYMYKRAYSHTAYSYKERGVN